MLLRVPNPHAYVLGSEAYRNIPLGGLCAAGDYMHVGGDDGVGAREDLGSGALEG